jgi:hypothetical protein
MTDTNGGFWVSVNASSGAVRVHRGTCGYCNDGLGVSSPESPAKRTRWLGPFPDRTEALATAESLRKENTASCRVCQP